MRAVILSGGQVTGHPSELAAARQTDVLVCADSGYDHALRLGLRVDAVVGDMDSINAVPDAPEILRLAPEKDETDTEAAIAYARRLGCDSFTLLGCIGSRMDHSLTNILLLVDFHRRGESARLIDAHNEIFLIADAFSVHAPVGTLLSLVPITECRGVTTHGLYYPLSDATLKVGKGLGVSNVFCKPFGGFSLREGLMLVMFSRD